METRPTKIHLAALAGIFATTGSLFGKLAGGVDIYSLASIVVNGTFLVLMIVANTVGCTLFVKSMQGTDSSLPATVVSAATNYFCSALTGFLMFGESTSLMWWCGTSLVLLGLLLICYTRADGEATTSLRKEQ